MNYLSSKINGIICINTDKSKAYWAQNLKIMVGLLLLWFVVSFGCGILFVDELDQIKIGGFGLGFWFAQQGSIYVFVGIIFLYTFLMNRLDKKFDVDEK